MTRKSLTDLAAQLLKLSERLASSSPDAGGGTFQGSAHRSLPEDLRAEIVDARSDLMERGIFDPVLIRFDTATVTQASNDAIATRLREVGESLAAPPAQP